MTTMRNYIITYKYYYTIDSIFTTDHSFNTIQISLQRTRGYDANCHANHHILSKFLCLSSNSTRINISMPAPWNVLHYAFLRPCYIVSNNH